jgi:predicted RNA polymerase sigma factor
VRAKAKIREERIPYEVPTPQELPERLGAVLQVIYLVFNEGYSAAAGAEVTRADELRKNGHLVSQEPLQPANTAVTVGWKNGKVAVTDGPYAETTEQLNSGA